VNLAFEIRTLTHLIFLINYFESEFGKTIAIDRVLVFFPFNFFKNLGEDIKIKEGYKFNIFMRRSDEYYTENAN
jgi:hypothetical protein